MQLPSKLLAALEAETSRFDRGQLARAAAELSERYKHDGPGPAISSDVHRAAYLAVRLPATFAAAHRVFHEVKARLSQLEIQSMLDLGAGPGTALLAAKDVFPSLAHATLLEADAGWLRPGQNLTRTARVETKWLHRDLRNSADFGPHDLVVISYALGELPEAARESLLGAAWQRAGRLLVIVEPGTMRGFAAVNAARSWLLAAGASLVAPCPHQHACPMAAAGDWCHFAQRVERTSLHRSLKGGALGHEDEKFSYVAAARHPGALPAARIVRHPQRHTGHVQLILCTAQGLAHTTITRSHKQAYKQARQADWGDAWNES